MNIISCHIIGYQNGCFTPNTIFTIANDNIAHNHAGVMADSLRGEFYTLDEQDNPILNTNQYGYVFGAYQHDVVGTDEKKIATIIRNNGANANTDVPVYILSRMKENRLPMVMVGRITPMGEIEVFGCYCCSNQWRKYEPTDTDVVYYTLSPLVAELKKILGKMYRKAKAREHKEQMETKRTMDKAAELREKIRLMQAQDKATSGL